MPHLWDDSNLVGSPPEEGERGVESPYSCGLSFLDRSPLPEIPRSSMPRWQPHGAEPQIRRHFPDEPITSLDTPILECKDAILLHVLLDWSVIPKADTKGMSL